MRKRYLGEEAADRESVERSESRGRAALLIADRPGGMRGGNMSDSEPCMRAGAGNAQPQGTCDFVLMLPRYSEGTSSAGGV